VTPLLQFFYHRLFVCFECSLVFFGLLHWLLLDRLAAPLPFCAVSAGGDRSTLDAARCVGGNIQDPCPALRLALNYIHRRRAHRLRLRPSWPFRRPRHRPLVIVLVVVLCCPRAPDQNERLHCRAADVVPRHRLPPSSSSSSSSSSSRHRCRTLGSRPRVIRITSSSRARVYSKP
jgi:hypothetical protein